MTAARALAVVLVALAACRAAPTPPGAEPVSSASGPDAPSRSAAASASTPPPRSAASSSPPSDDPWKTASWDRRPLLWEPWSRRPDASVADFHAVFGTSANDVWIGGEDGTVLRTRDRGRTFRRAELPGGDTIVSIWGARPDDMWIAGTRHVYRAFHDTIATVSVERGVQDRAGVWGLSPMDVWIAHGVLVHTIDGGATWTKIRDRVPYTADGATSVFAGSALDIWTDTIFGILHSSDGGATWAHPEYDVQTEDDFRVRGHDPNDVWIVGSVQGPSRSTDHGATWREERPPLPPPSGTSVWWGDLWTIGHGWAWLTTSIGVWVRPGRPPWRRVFADGGMLSVWASGPGDVWAVGQRGRILHTLQ